MEKKNVILKQQNKSYIFVFIGLVMIIGLLSSFFTLNGPFQNYSNLPLFDVLKITTIILIIALLLYFVASRISKKLVILILTALFLRILVVFIMSFFGLLPYQYDSNWDVDASILLSQWHQGNFNIEIGNSTVSFYSLLTTIIYFLLGENPIYMQLLNVFFSSFTIYYLYQLTKDLFNKKIAERVSILMVLWPSYIFFSSMHMRESLAIFFIVAFTFYFTRWLKYFHFKYIVLISLFFILNILIRKQNAGLLFIVIMPFILYYLWKFSNKNLKIIIVILFLFLTFGLIVLLKITGYLNYLDFNYIAGEMNYRSSGGSGYLEWMNYSSFFDIIIYAPLRFIYFTFTPFPWQVSGIQQFFAFFESVLLIVMGTYIIKNFKNIWVKSNKRNALFFIIVFCLIGLIANGIVDSNVGTAIRHKLQYIFLFFILFSAIKYYKKENSP